MSTAIVAVDRLAYEPRDVTDALATAARYVTGGLISKSIRSPEAALTIMAVGRELGLTTMQSLRSIHIIDGKPTLSAELMVGLVKTHPSCAYFMLIESTVETAVYETQRNGEPKPTRMSYGIDKAKLAGITGKDNWRKHPDAMLRARCASALARAVYPDVVGGLYDPDELAAPEPRDVTPPVRQSRQPVIHVVATEPEPMPVQASPVPVDAVIEAEVVAPPPPPMSAAAVALASRIAAADRSVMLDIGSEIRAAHKAGALTDDERETLRGIYSARMAALKAVA